MGMKKSFTQFQGGISCSLLVGFRLAACTRRRFGCISIRWTPACVVYEQRLCRQAGSGLQALAPLRVRMAVPLRHPPLGRDRKQAIWNIAEWFRLGGAVPAGHADSSLAVRQTNCSQFCSQSVPGDDRGKPLGLQPCSYCSQHS
jgi:hypothetical protein